ncbi:MAG: dienelactone hydrolase family protein, partial [Planctomycetota bacterium]
MVVDILARLGTAAIASATWLGGCTHMRLDPDYAGPAPRPDAIEAPFRYDRSGTMADVVVAEPNEDGFRRVTFGSAVNYVDEHDLVVDLLDPGGETPRAIVLVLPILGGDNEIATHFARHFAKKGFAAAIVHRQDDYKDTTELDELNRVFRQIVVDHMQVLDWLETQEGIDAQ